MSTLRWVVIAVCTIIVCIVVVLNVVPYDPVDDQELAYQRDYCLTFLRVNEQVSCLEQVDRWAMDTYQMWSRTISTSWVIGALAFSVGVLTLFLSFFIWQKRRTKVS